MTAGDPFAAMAAALTAAAPPPLSRAEATARRLGRAAELLRASGDQAAIEVAEGFDRWLTEGGDLRAHLGVKGRRGHARDLPAVDGPLRRRDALLRKLAVLVREPGLSERALVARVVTILGEPRITRCIRELSGCDTVPMSGTRLRSILRAP